MAGGRCPEKQIVDDEPHGRFHECENITVDCAIIPWPSDLSTQITQKAFRPVNALVS